MTYFITAYNNARTMIIEAEAQTSDKDLVDIISDFWQSKGWYVTHRSES